MSIGFTHESEKFFQKIFGTLLQTGHSYVYITEMKKDLLTSTFMHLRASLFTKARTLLADDEDARDVLQDAFFKLWQNHPDIERESHATGLLVTAVRNLSIDRLRRRQTRPEIHLDDMQMPDEAPNEDGTEERAEIYNRVQRLVSRHLSPRDREILLRRDRDEWSFEEIAIEYDITPANARLIVARARKTIRTLYNTSNE